LNCALVAERLGSHKWYAAGNVSSDLLYLGIRCLGPSGLDLNEIRSKSPLDFVTFAVSLLLELSAQRTWDHVQLAGALTNKPAKRWRPFILGHILVTVAALVATGVGTQALAAECSGAQLTATALSGVTCRAASYRLYAPGYCGCDAAFFEPGVSPVCAGFGKYGDQGRLLAESWSDLRYINIWATIGHCTFTPYDMETISRWTRVQYLGVSGLKTPIPQSWDQLTALRSLYLTQIGITDLPSTVVREWRQLERLDVRLSPTLAVVPAEVWDLPQLSEVRLYGTAACEDGPDVPERWRRRACGAEEEVCPGFPQWLFEEVTWKAVSGQTRCGGSGCESGFNIFAHIDANEDALWSQGDFSYWFARKLMESGLDPGVVTLSEEGISCFFEHATKNASKTHLSAAEVSSFLVYSTCEDCPDFPVARDTPDPKTHPECANATDAIDIIAVGEALCAPPSECTEACPLVNSLIRSADSNGDGRMTDLELMALAAAAGANTAFPGVSRCAWSWSQCDTGAEDLSVADTFVACMMFSNFPATTCGDCQW